MHSTSPIANATSINLTKANQLLKKAAQLLFGVAVIGQLLFALHIVTFYGSSLFTGNYDKWNQELSNGLIEGDLIGNIALVIHLLLAAVITLGGPLQFIPKFRTKFPVFHRWNGRIYIITAFLISLAGLYMVFARGVIGGTIMGMGNTLNATLIMIFAALAWKTAMAKDFKTHKKWALRTFLMASGVWFFRIGFGIWIAFNGGTAPGSSEDLGGPFDIFLTFAHSLLPWIILELYFYIKQKNNATIKVVMATFLVLLSGVLGIGIFMATMIFWMPHWQSV